jgi:hypothetical protein
LEELRIVRKTGRGYVVASVDENGEGKVEENGVRDDGLGFLDEFIVESRGVLVESQS